jgi:MerR family transcriptional regulator, light-induced transcriptional regulator
VASRTHPRQGPTEPPIGSTAGPVERHARRRDSRPRRRVVREFVAAALSGDLLTSAAIAMELMRIGRSRADVITDLFDAAQGYVAERWRQGEATAEHELLVSEAIATSMKALPEPSRPARQSGSAFLVTISPEAHDLGLDLVAAALTDDGWDVEIRPGVGISELVEHAQRGRFSLVGISSTYVTSQLNRQLAGAVAALHAVGKLVIAGGSAFRRAPELADQIGVDIVAVDAREAVVVARRLRSTDRRRWSGSRQAAVS